MTTEPENHAANSAVLQEFRNSYIGTWGDWPDGSEITPDTIACGFFNNEAEILETGEIEIGYSGHVADEDETARFIKYLRDNGNV